MAGLIPAAGGMAPYATTKYGVVGLSLGLRSAGAEYGVKVSVLCPGWIDTPMLDGEMPEGLPVPPSMRDARPLREALIEAGQTIYPVDRLAEDTLAGLAKNKAIIVVPRQWQRYWLLARLMPGQAARQAEKLTHLFRKHAASA